LGQTANDWRVLGLLNPPKTEGKKGVKTGLWGRDRKGGSLEERSPRQNGVFWPWRKKKGVGEKKGPYWRTPTKLPLVDVIDYKTYKKPPSTK